MVSAFVKCDLSDAFIKKWLESLDEKNVRYFIDSDGIRFMSEQFMLCPNGSILACNLKDGYRKMVYEIPYGITCKNHVIME